MHFQNPRQLASVGSLLDSPVNMLIVFMILSNFDDRITRLVTTQYVNYVPTLLKLPNQYNNVKCETHKQTRQS